MHLVPDDVRARRDLIDHVIVLNERHLKRLMNEYVGYYHEDRTHLALAKGTPANREAMSNTGFLSNGVMPRLGGLHHRYDLAAGVSVANISPRSRKNLRKNCVR